MAGASLYLHCAGQNHAVIKFCSCIQDTPAARECQACCLHFCLGCTWKGENKRFFASAVLWLAPAKQPWFFFRYTRIPSLYHMARV